MLARAERLAFGATLALPFVLLHATSVGEGIIGLVSAVFVWRSWALRDWRWTRRLWVRVALVWWTWLVVCSAFGPGGLGSVAQAALTARYLVFVAALENAVLSTAIARLWMWRSVAAAALYYAVQSTTQFLFGRNLFGVPPNLDGVLTDPIGKARVAAPLSRMVLPAILPLVAPMLARGRARDWTGAALIVAGSVAAIAIIGQRMPLMLTFLGLFVAALAIRRLRPVALLAVASTAALIAASSVVAPDVFQRQVTRFSDQMEHFQTSDYGRIADRAVAIVQQHPWMGRGFDGFRRVCADPRYFRSWTRSLPHLPGETVPGCNIHPHNHYLQAATDAGLPGLLLWSALVVSWLLPLGHGLIRAPSPLRVGLFAAAVIGQWPLASTSSMFAVEIEGFFFLLLGWGLAEARAAAG